jgi:hypothetical protein
VGVVQYSGTFYLLAVALVMVFGAVGIRVKYCENKVDKAGR